MPRTQFYPYKLMTLAVPERKAILVVRYEHASAKVDLTPLVKPFETTRRMSLA